MEKWYKLHVVSWFGLSNLRSWNVECQKPVSWIYILQVRLNIGMSFLESMCISYFSYPPTTFCPDVQATMRRRGSGIAYLIGITIVPQLRLFKNRTTRSSLLCLYAIWYVWLQYDIHIIEYIIYIYTLYFVEFVIGFCHVIDQCFWILKPWPV